MELLSTLGFPLLTFVFHYLFYRQLKGAIFKTNWSAKRKQKVTFRIGIGLLTWAALVSVVSLSGFTSRFELFPLNAMPVLLVPLITILALVLSKPTKEILPELPLRSLTQLQVFRVFVELVLWLLFLQNQLPVQITFEGLNWDVLTGISALLAVRFFLNSKPAMIIWNVAGLGLLINIVVVSILSMPTPFRVFSNEPANVIVTQFPYLYLPASLVSLAYTLHFMSLRKLLLKQ
ncbi:MAG: hypothetical protein KF856_07310 [Cyclobacteriaceae bacterium]|nr:hypothetical protein [Cyclobacteriaceae bacterium]